MKKPEYIDPDMKALFEKVKYYCKTKVSEQIEMLLDCIKPLYEKQDKSSIGFPNKYQIIEAGVNKNTVL